MVAAEKSDAVKVAVRVRPLMQRDTDEGARECLRKVAGEPQARPAPRAPAAPAPRLAAEARHDAPTRVAARARRGSGVHLRPRLQAR